MSKSFYILEGIVILRSNIENIDEPILINKKDNIWGFRVGLIKPMVVKLTNTPYLLLDPDDKSEMNQFGIFYHRPNEKQVLKKYKDITKWLKTGS
jgi:hypothetical protein